MCVEIFPLGVWLKAKTGAHAGVSESVKLLKSLQSANAARTSGMEDTKVSSQRCFMQHLLCATFHSIYCIGSCGAVFPNVG